MQAGIDIEGNKNKVAGRDFIEVLVPTAQVEYLTAAQRKQLNDQVKKIAEEHGLLAGVIWKQVVHIPFGVDALAKIQLGKYAEVDRALVEYSHALTLTKLVQVRSQGKVAMSKVEAWALREYGARELQYLKPDELKRVLEYVEGLPAPEPGLPLKAAVLTLNPPPRPATPAPPKLHAAVVKRQRRGGIDRWWRMMGRLMLRWPSHVLVLSLASAVVGRLFL